METPWKRHERLEPAPQTLWLPAEQASEALLAY